LAGLGQDSLCKPGRPPRLGRMSAWFWLIALGLCVMLLGLYLHWSIVLLGGLLPFVPITAELIRRRRRRGP